MKTSTVFIIGGAAIGVWYMSQLGAAVATVNVVLQGVQIKSLTHYVVTLTVQNISNIACDVNSMSGTIFLNGQSISNIANFSKRTVPANGQVNIDCDISPDIMGLPGVVLDLIQGKTETLAFTVKGNFNVNGLILPFELDKTINV